MADSKHKAKLDKPFHSEFNFNETNPNRILPGGAKDTGVRMPSRAEQADIDERQARPWKQLRGAFYSMIGDAPILGPADHEGAAAYLTKIRLALARGGWTNSEWKRLRQLHVKWARRAEGRDPWFEVYGNQRQWADHGREMNKDAGRKEVKEVKEVVANIQEILRQEVVNQRRLLPEDETPAEKRARMEAVDKVRFRVQEGDKPWD